MSGVSALVYLSLKVLSGQKNIIVVEYRGLIATQSFLKLFHDS